jgi:hypothetical protein
MFATYSGVMAMRTISKAAIYAFVLNAILAAQVLAQVKPP